MRLGQITVTGFFIAISLFLFASCGKSCGTCQGFETCVNGVCKDVRPCAGTCNSHEECVNSTCQCIDGWSGSGCGSKNTGIFVNGYTIVETYSPPFDGHSNAQFTTLIIDDSITVNKVFINNFGNKNISVYGSTSNLTLTIPTQNTSGYQVSGHGTIDRATKLMNLTYQVTYGGITSNCTASYQGVH